MVPLSSFPFAKEHNKMHWFSPASVNLRGMGILDTWGQSTPGIQVIWPDQRGSNYVLSGPMPQDQQECGLECSRYQPKFFMHMYSPAGNSLTVLLIQWVNKISLSMLSATLVSMVVNEKKIEKNWIPGKHAKKVSITILTQHEYCHKECPLFQPDLFFLWNFELYPSLNFCHVL